MILIHCGPMHLDDFKLEILDIGVIQAKLTFESAIRYPALALQHGQGLIQDLLKRHTAPPITVGYTRSLSAHRPSCSTIAHAGAKRKQDMQSALAPRGFRTPVVVGTHLGEGFALVRTKTPARVPQGDAIDHLGCRGNAKQFMNSL